MGDAEAALPQSAAGLVAVIGGGKISRQLVTASAVMALLPVLITALVLSGHARTLSSQREMRDRLVPLLMGAQSTAEVAVDLRGRLQELLAVDSKVAAGSLLASVALAVQRLRDEGEGLMDGTAAVGLEAADFPRLVGGAHEHVSEVGGLVGKRLDAAAEFAALLGEAEQAVRAMGHAVEAARLEIPLTDSRRSGAREALGELQRAGLTLKLLIGRVDVDPSPVTLREAAWIAMRDAARRLLEVRDDAIRMSISEKFYALGEVIGHASDRDVFQARALEIGATSRLESMHRAANAALGRLESRVAEIRYRASVDAVRATEEAIRDSRRGVWVVLLATAAVLVFSILFFWRFVYGRISKPIEELIHSMERVADGDLQAPIPDGSQDDFGRIARAVGVFRDQSQALQDRTRDLEDSAVQLRALNEELGQFIRVASHDLKAPLRGVRAMTEIVLRDAGDVIPAESVEHLETVCSRVQRLDRMIDDLLEYSRIQALEQRSELVLLRSLIDAAVQSVVLPPKFAVEVDVDVAEPVEMQVDAASSALRALLQNAVKHHDRPAEGRVRIHAFPDGADVVIEVSDNGPGIDPAFADRVFEVFSTLRPRDVVEGSGIGLAIVRRQMEVSGGSVELVQSQERGARFRLCWPGRIACAPS